jgi:hypothetical protein
MTGAGGGRAGSGPHDGSFVGIGGASGSSPDGAVPACEDLTRTLPTPCVPLLCDCAALADCDLKCWIDVACIRQRCAGKADPSCADACGDPGGVGRDAVRRCVTLTPECGGMGSCGDGVVTPPETCDGENFIGKTCRDFGFKSGELACSSTCDLDPLDCTSCGDGVVDMGEDCDGNVQVSTCTDVGFLGGTLGCDAKCHFDTSACTACGNGRLDKAEECDGELFPAGVNCRDHGFSGGMLSCKSCSLDTKSCAVCGNGVVEAGENCDGAAFGGATCTTLGFASGTLACDPEECRLDVSGCAAAMPRCGDGIAERGEQCDGKDLAGLDCKAFGFDKGTLGCNPATCRFDETGCARAPRDTCKECRELNCKYYLDSCLADPHCVEGLHCIETCFDTDSMPGLLGACTYDCFADDFIPGRRSDMPQAIALLSMLWGCTAGACVDDCVNPLSGAAL